MAKIKDTRRTERAGVNAFRALMESAGHIFQEIDGGNDYGEDCYLSLTENGRRTGDIVAVQVKSGVSYKQARGYVIPCGKHVEDWARSRIPVIGVVYDPEMRELYWVNLSQALKGQVAKGKKPSYVSIDENAILDSTTVHSMIADVQSYIVGTYGPPVSLEGLRYALRDAWDQVQEDKRQKFENAPLGGLPIRSFEKEAEFHLRHPKFLPALIKCSVWAVAFLVSFVIAPGLYHVARSQYGLFMSWLWVITFYGLFWTLLHVSGEDSNRRRASLLRNSGMILLAIGWYVGFPHVSTVQTWTVPPLVEVVIMGAIPGAAKAALLCMSVHYVRQEIGRKRRLSRRTERSDE
ncbi:DUF4365 domain-containing protein [Streptomyces sp. NPDC050315]|uniref:DUF4365 domain-containing protein n=1 Tax=Streptomyces sp. NPDC050315 TaxID=3155039 RepID=UPI0034251E2D